MTTPKKPGLPEAYMDGYTEGYREGQKAERERVVGILVRLHDIAAKKHTQFVLLEAISAVKEGSDAP